MQTLKQFLWKVNIIFSIYRQQLPIYNIMKSQSLLSQLSNLSNLSHLSNISYHGEKKEYIGTEFFKQSLPFCYYTKLSNLQIKQEQIQLESLGVEFLKNFAPVKECAGAFTPYWATELRQNMEGTSDNQNQFQPQIVKKQQQAVKLEEESSSQKIKQQQKLSRESSSENEERNEKIIKNQTKNIPKNYGKAIIIFFQKNKELIQRILAENDDDYEDLMHKLKNLKKKINTISDLRDLWQAHPESKSLRIVSNYFLRKHSLQYIYNSRIKTRLCHAKYKRRLQQAITNPKEFNYIKDY